MRYLLRVGTVRPAFGESHLGWLVVNGATGETVAQFRYHAQASAWLTGRGYAHTGYTAGETQAEVWTKEQRA